ncbi:MAG: gamma carbonic anhydrase family protein [Methanobacteriota archaeon]|nr:MAG: gamma carbonic anhydrase family protein [Euryarchaeota archaeon]
MIYVAPTAVIVGDVAIGDGSSVWYGAVVRGDLDRIVIGENCSIQDNCALHTDKGNPILMGSRITVGHAAVVHGCTIGDDCLIGMNATVASRAKIGAGTIVAAGAVVTEGTEFPPNSVVAGVPAKRIKDAEEHHRLRIEIGWRIYTELATKSLPAREDIRGDPTRQIQVAFTNEFENL